MIDNSHLNCTPSMSLNEIVLELFQKYGRSSVKLIQENENYHITYERDYYNSPNYKIYPRNLTPAEAFWVGKQVEGTLKNTDDSTWESLPGGDKMNIVITNCQKNIVELHKVKLISKYYNLMSDFERLVQYGSQSQ